MTPTAWTTTAAAAAAVSPSCRGHNFGDWRAQIAGRKKMEQILNAFKDELDPSIKKYLCAPCSNCKGQLRDILAYYDLWEKHTHPVRRSGRAHRQLHDRRQARLHRVGVALDSTPAGDFPRMS